MYIIESGLVLTKPRLTFFSAKIPRILISAAPDPHPTRQKLKDSDPKHLLGKNKIAQLAIDEISRYEISQKNNLRI
jgi:hypothetical protein